MLFRVVVAIYIFFGLLRVSVAPSPLQPLVLQRLLMFARLHLGSSSVSVNAFGCIFFLLGS